MSSATPANDPLSTQSKEGSPLRFPSSPKTPEGTTPSTTTGKTRSCALPIIFGVVGVLLVAGGVASGVALGLHFSHTVLLLSTPSWMPMFCILATPVGIAAGTGCIVMAVAIVKNRTEPDSQEDVSDTASKHGSRVQNPPKDVNDDRKPSSPPTLSVRPRSKSLPNLPALDQEPRAHVSDGSPRYKKTASAHNQALQKQEAERAKTRLRSSSVPGDLGRAVEETPVSPTIRPTSGGPSFPKQPEVPNLLKRTLPPPSHLSGASSSIPIPSGIQTQIFTPPPPGPSDGDGSLGVVGRRASVTPPRAPTQPPAHLPGPTSLPNSEFNPPVPTLFPSPLPTTQSPVTLTPPQTPTQQAGQVLASIANAAFTAVQWTATTAIPAVASATTTVAKAAAAGAAAAMDWYKGDLGTIEKMGEEGLALLSEAAPYDSQTIEKIQKWCETFDAFVAQKILAFGHPNLQRSGETSSSIKELLNKAFEMQYAVSRHLYEKISKLPPDTYKAILASLDTKHWQALLPIHHYLALANNRETAQRQDCYNAWQTIFEFHRMSRSSFTNPEYDTCSKAIANVMLLQQHALSQSTEDWKQLFPLPLYVVGRASETTQQLPIAAALLYRMANLRNVQNQQAFLDGVLTAYGIPVSPENRTAVTQQFQTTGALVEETSWRPDQEQALEQKVLPNIMQLHAALIRLAAPQGTPGGSGRRSPTPGASSSSAAVEASPSSAAGRTSPLARRSTSPVGVPLPTTATAPPTAPTAPPTDAIPQGQGTREPNPQDMTDLHSFILAESSSSEPPLSSEQEARRSIVIEFMQRDRGVEGAPARPAAAPSAEAFQPQPWWKQLALKLGMGSADEQPLAEQARRKKCTSIIELVASSKQLLTVLAANQPTPGGQSFLVTDCSEILESVKTSPGETSLAATRLCGFALDRWAVLSAKTMEALLDLSLRKSDPTEKAAHEELIRDAAQAQFNVIREIYQCLQKWSPEDRRNVLGQVSQEGWQGLLPLAYLMDSEIREEDLTLSQEIMTSWRDDYLSARPEQPDLFDEGVSEFALSYIWTHFDADTITNLQASCATLYDSDENPCAYLSLAHLTLIWAQERLYRDDSLLPPDAPRTVDSQEALLGSLLNILTGFCKALGYTDGAISTWINGTNEKEGQKTLYQKRAGPGEAPHGQFQVPQLKAPGAANFDSLSKSSPVLTSIRKKHGEWLTAAAQYHQKQKAAAAQAASSAKPSPKPSGKKSD